MSNLSSWDEGGYTLVSVLGISVASAIANVLELAGHIDELSYITITDLGHESAAQIAKLSGAMALPLTIDPKPLATIKEDQVRWQELGLKSELLTDDMIRK